MGLWRKVCAVLTVLLLAAAVLLGCFGSPLARYSLEQDVRAYLAEAGYRAEDLTDLTVEYNRREQNKYVVRVIFADKPDAPRYYYCDDDLEIRELQRAKE